MAKANAEAAATLSSNSNIKTNAISASAVTKMIESNAPSPVAVNNAVLDAKSRAGAAAGSEPVQGEPLVNFERHRTAAAIVKSLLRLLHASSKYDFKPIPEVVSRCLWMAALPDDEITARSRSLV